MEQELREYLASPTRVLGSSRDAIAVVAPHAGWMYSGRIAGQTYAEVRVPDRVVVLCPNHTGLGVRRPLWATGSWRIPGGDVVVEAALAERLQIAPRTRLKFPFPNQDASPALYRPNENQCEY